jgi:hypothetical protein
MTQVLDHARPARAPDALKVAHRPASQHAIRDDPADHELDRVGSRVPAGGMLQRACACGGTPGEDGECAACRAKRLGLQRKGDGEAAGVAPPIVHDVLASRGQPLDSPSRSFFERRLGHDLSGVRVHTGERAASSARAVSARAYTVGSDVVFGAGEYAPNTHAGRQLLAHELVHVAQQRGSTPRGSLRIQPANDALEAQADSVATAALAGDARPALGSTAPVVARTFQASKTNCVAGERGAPANVDTELPAIDKRAGELATQVAEALEKDPPDANVRTALQNRFGLPPVFPGGASMNRLTGATVADQDAAIAGELAVLARRFRLSAKLFSEPMFYRCVGPEGGSTIDGCAITNALCATGDSWSCAGVGAIFMCPQFWTKFVGTDGRALVLVHETFHINFANVGETVPAGSGGHYRNASCYESFAHDITGAPVVDTCPP